MEPSITKQAGKRSKFSSPESEGEKEEEEKRGDEEGNAGKEQVPASEKGPDEKWVRGTQRSLFHYETLTRPPLAQRFCALAVLPGGSW